MYSNTDDIVPGSDRTDPQKWMDYLDGKLSGEERLRLEAEIAQSEFLKDALEGLHPNQGKIDLNAVVNQLNQQLRNQLAAKKTLKKRQTKLSGNSWLWIAAVAAILGICLLGYYCFVYFSAHPPFH